MSVELLTPESENQTVPEFKKTATLHHWLVPVAIVLVALLFVGVPNGRKASGDMLAGAVVQQNTVTVFFSKLQGSQSITEPVSRELPQIQAQEPLRFAIEQLLKGPTSDEKAAGFYSEIPAGTQLISVDTRGKQVTLNFSAPFASGGGSTSMVQRLDQVKKTAYAVDREHEVRIHVQGQSLKTLGGEGLEVPETLQRELP